MENFLLDFSKKNQLINFKKESKTCVRIDFPNYIDIFEDFVKEEKEIVFPFIKKSLNDQEEIYENIIEGNVKTEKSVLELQKILKNLI